MARPNLIIGIDPGGKQTGVIHMDATKGAYAGHWLRERSPGQPVPAYAALTAQWLYDHLWDHHNDGRAVLVAIETVTPPTGFNRRGKKQPINPAGIIDVSTVFGGLVAACQLFALESTTPIGSLVRLVEPKGNGATPDLPRGRALDAYMRQHYPSKLLPSKNGTAYTDAMRHCRSAWDVARKARGAR